MLDITTQQLESIRSSTELGRQVRSILSDKSLVSKPITEMTSEQMDEVRDACEEALINDAPVVEELLAEQSKGVYPIQICGVPGAYFVHAQEFDREGLFSTLDDAIACVESDHGEFLLRDPSDSTEDADDDELDEADGDDTANPDLPDGLMMLLAGGEYDAEGVRETILSTPILLDLANGNLENAGPLPQPIEDHLAAFEATLPKPTGYPSGMARLMKLAKLRIRLRLYWTLHQQIPSAKLTKSLFDYQ
jgi:hypothetical protein